MTLGDTAILGFLSLAHLLLLVCLFLTKFQPSNQFFLKAFT